MARALFLVLALVVASSAIRHPVNPTIRNRLVSFNESYSAWMSQEEVEKTASECGASGKHTGFMDITDHQDLQPTGRFDKLSAAASKFPSKLSQQTLVKSLFPRLVKSQLQDYNDQLTSYGTRLYSSLTGEQSALWIKSEFERIKGSRTDITVTSVKHSFRQPSIIASIKGNGEHADEIVIIGLTKIASAIPTPLLVLMTMLLVLPLSCCSSELLLRAA